MHTRGNRSSPSVSYASTLDHANSRVIQSEYDCRCLGCSPRTWRGDEGRSRRSALPQWRSASGARVGPLAMPSSLSRRRRKPSGAAVHLRGRETKFSTLGRSR